MYTNRRYFILILLFIASMINYIDRAALSILAPYITADLNVNKAELGLIFSSFAIGYAVFCFIGGWLAGWLINMAHDAFLLEPWGYGRFLQA